MTHRPEYDLARTLIEERKAWTGDNPADDQWGFIMALSFDLAEHLLFNECTLVDDYSPGCGEPDEETLADLWDQFGEYPAEALLEVANGPLVVLRDLIKANGLDY